jgi:hypothetical protein
MAAVCVCVSASLSVCLSAEFSFVSQLLQKFTDFNIPLTKMMPTQDPLASTSAAERKNFFVLIALKATLPTFNARSETSASRSTRM